MEHLFKVWPQVAECIARAIRFLVEKYLPLQPEERPVSIYLGDGLTDEDGFRFLRKSERGRTVYVGGQPQDSAAEDYLTSTGEVYRFLSWMLEYLQRSLTCRRYLAL